MSREFPDFVDPWKAADGRRTFRGTMPLKWMRRLAPMLAPESEGSGQSRTVVWNDAAFTAHFSYDEQGLVTIQLDVEAELPLICQRSLAPYQEKINRSSLLAVVEGIKEQELVPESYEPVLVEEGRMALLDIVEEELLLAVPQVPKNPDIGEIELSTDGEVRYPSGSVEESPDKEKSHRPFAGLAGLMKADLED